MVRTAGVLKDDCIMLSACFCAALGALLPFPRKVCIFLVHSEILAFDSDSSLLIVGVISIFFALSVRVSLSANSVVKLAGCQCNWRVYLVFALLVLLKCYLSIHGGSSFKLPYITRIALLAVLHTFKWHHEVSSSSSSPGWWWLLSRSTSSTTAMHWLRSAASLKGRWAVAEWDAS